MKKRPKLSHSNPAGRDSIERKTVLTAYPTNLAATTVKLGYEFRLSKSTGFKLIASYGNADNYGASYPNTFYNVPTFSEYTFEGQLRFYVGKETQVLNGVYVSPYLFYKSMNYVYDVSGNSLNQFDTQKESFNVSDFSIGYLVGYQYIFGSRFTIDGFIGAGDNIISGNNTYGSINQIYGYPRGIMVHMGVGLGIAF